MVVVKEVVIEKYFTSTYRALKEKAGILKDDILVAVGDNTSNDITQYKNLLETIGDEIRLLINRNGTLYQFTIKPISIK